VIERPAALDSPLGHLTANLREEADAYVAESRAALARLEAKARELKAQERAEHRAAVLREAIDVAREEGNRLEEVAGIAQARGARCVAYLLRKLLVKTQPAGRCANDTDGDGDCAACARHPEAPCRRVATERSEGAS
jgi:hypothetical protein